MTVGMCSIDSFLDSQKREIKALNKSNEELEEEKEALKLETRKQKSTIEVALRQLRQLEDARSNIPHIKEETASDEVLQVWKPNEE